MKGESKQIETFAQGQRRVRQSGEWDSTILCCDCESSLSSIDRYGHEMCIELRNAFLDAPRKYRYTPDIVQISYSQIRSFDPKLTEQFLLSVLWRASVSNRPVVSNFSIGEAEKCVGEIAFGRPFDEGLFPYLIEWTDHDDTIDPHKLVWFPTFSATSDGLNTAYFSIYGISFSTILNRPFGNSSTRLHGDPRLSLQAVRMRLGMRNEYKALKPYFGL